MPWQKWHVGQKVRAEKFRQQELEAAGRATPRWRSREQGMRATSTVRKQRAVTHAGAQHSFIICTVQGLSQGMDRICLRSICLPTSVKIAKIIPHGHTQGHHIQMILDFVKLTTDTKHQRWVNCFHQNWKISVICLFCSPFSLPSI